MEKTLMDEYYYSIKQVNKNHYGPPTPCPANFAFNGKIMLISVVILFVALVIIASFHMYTRWFLLRWAHRQDLDSGNANNGIIASSTCIPPASQGLGPSVLKALPTFLYSSKTHDPSLECPVCLSEFEDDERGRTLPKCNHCFHVDCIDMWFQSHSNCPLCRAPVQNPDGIVVLVVQVEPPETDASPGLCPDYQRVHEQMQMACCPNTCVPIASSSLADDRKLAELTSISVEAPVLSEDQGTSSAQVGRIGTRAV